jgi:hypothetical protein
LRKYPDLKIAWSEGGIGWLPFYLDRCDRHYLNQRWLRQDFGSRLPSEVFKEHCLACVIADPSALVVRDRIGIDVIAFESDYPHSDCLWPDAPEHLLGELDGAGASDAEIDKISWETPPVSLLGNPSPIHPGRRQRSAPCAPKPAMSMSASVPGRNGGPSTRRSSAPDRATTAPTR